MHSFTESFVWALGQIKKFARKEMGTSDVRVDVRLNKEVWKRGISNVPMRVRVQIARLRNDDEDAKEDMYSYVTHAELPSTGFSGLGTKIVED